MEYTTGEWIIFMILVIIAVFAVRWMLRYDAKQDEMNARPRYEQAEKCKPAEDGGACRRDAASGGACRRDAASGGACRRDAASGGEMLFMN